MASLCSPKAATPYASVSDWSQKTMMRTKRKKESRPVEVQQRLSSQFPECTRNTQQNLGHALPGSLCAATGTATATTSAVRLGGASRGGGVMSSSSSSSGDAREEDGWKRLSPPHRKRQASGAVRCAVPLADGGGVQESPHVQTGRWTWEGHSIRYMRAGDSGPILLLVHGFGANCEHWRKNVGVLGQTHRVYALDLLGYGLSDKPDPRSAPPNSLYSFDTWSRQCLDFLHHVAQGPAFIICNSIGGVTGLAAAVERPEMVRGVVLLNVSLRMLHVRKQMPLARPFIRAFQHALRSSNLGRLFFSSVAKPDAVASILRQAYHDKSAVTEELVEAILRPGLMPGAVDVFLDFISYSSGPLPEDLLPLTQCPVLIAWGDKDPWEPIELGRAYQHFDCVQDFVVLPNVGHCPQDEAPHLVNPLIQQFVAQHTNT